MPGVERVDRRDPVALDTRRDSGVRTEIEYRVPPGAKQGPLVGRRHIAAAPIGRSGNRASPGIQHGHVGRQVLVHGSQSVGQPAAQRGMPLDHLAAVDLKKRRAMGEGVHVERLDDGQLVHVPGDPGQGIGAPETRLTPALELAPRAQQLLLLDAPAANLYVDRLPIVLLQVGFVIKEVHLRGTAVHEQEDAALRLWNEMRRLRSQEVQIIRRSGFGVSVLFEEAILLEHGRHGYTGEARPGLPEELAASSAAELVPRR